MSAPDPTLRPGASDDQRPVAVIGELDGFHLGHRRMVDVARRAASAAGRPLVAVVIDDVARSETLLTVEERCRAALVAGCVAVRVVAIDSDGGVNPARSVLDEIVQVVDPAILVVARRAVTEMADDAPLLRSLGRSLSSSGIEVRMVDRWLDPDGGSINSQRLRADLRRGHVAAVSGWLGGPYEIGGPVVRGSGLGRTLGVPTANLDPPIGRVLPARGVYAARAVLPNGTRWPAAVNVGIRPTVENDGRMLVEAHLIGFDGDLYGVQLRIAFHHWLRSETQFASIDELVAQLADDIERVRVAVR